MSINNLTPDQDHDHDQVYQSSKTFPFQYIIDHLEMGWNWDGVSLNPTVTVNDIMDYPFLRWNYQILNFRFGIDE